MKNIEKVLAKLRTVDWGLAPQAPTEAMLEGVATYLRAYAIFVRAHYQEEVDVVTPFASPLKVLRAEDVMIPEAVVQEFKELVSRSPLAYDSVFGMRALEWAALCDAAHPATVGREQIFEPLLDLVLNRVSAVIRKGYWVIGESMYPLPDWINRYGPK